MNRYQELSYELAGVICDLTEDKADDICIQTLQRARETLADWADEAVVPAPPEAWVFVPTNPTKEMIAARSDGHCTSKDANARLIAAAPELLEALIELVEAGSDLKCNDDDVKVERFGTSFYAAKALVAKATGQEMSK